LEKPEGLSAAIVLTVKKGKEVQKKTFYIAEVPEHGADHASDPPLQPSSNLFWCLQRVPQAEDRKANMKQQIVQAQVNHQIAFPKDLKLPGAKQMIVTLEFPVFTNFLPLEIGEPLSLE